MVVSNSFYMVTKQTLRTLLKEKIRVWQTNTDLLPGNLQSRHVKVIFKRTNMDYLQIGVNGKVTVKTTAKHE